MIPQLDIRTFGVIDISIYVWKGAFEQHLAFNSNEEEVMKYLPMTLGVVAVCGVIAYGLYLTHEPNCLWGLFLVPAILSWLRPEDA